MTDNNGLTYHKTAPIKRGIFRDIQILADRSSDAIYHYAVSEKRYLF